MDEERQLTGNIARVNTGLTGAQSVQGLVRLACENPKPMELRIIADRPTTLADWTSLELVALLSYGIDGVEFQEELRVPFFGLVVHRVAREMTVGLRVDVVANVANAAQLVRGSLLANYRPADPTPESCDFLSVPATSTSTPQLIPDWARGGWFNAENTARIFRLLEPGGAVLTQLTGGLSDRNEFGIPPQAAQWEVQNTAASSGEVSVAWLKA